MKDNEKKAAIDELESGTTEGCDGIPAEFTRFTKAVIVIEPLKNQYDR